MLAVIRIPLLLTLALMALMPRVALGQSSGTILVRNDFNMSAEGWSISGDTGPMQGIFAATGGNPGGCITGIDQALGETWFFSAPDTVLRQLPAAVNGTLSYELRQSGAIISLNDDDVVIVGRAGRLSYRFPRAPGTDWTAFSVGLSAADGWTWNWNRPATQAQIDQVLSDPIRLEIRGEYVTGDDQGWLDTFVLRSGRPPTGPS
jgi:hypothetical protein